MQMDSCLLDNEVAARELEPVMNDEERTERTTHTKETSKTKSKVQILKSYVAEKGYKFKDIPLLYTKDKKAIVEKAAEVAPAPPAKKKPMEKHLDKLPPNYLDWLPKVTGATIQVTPIQEPIHG